MDSNEEAGICYAQPRSLDDRLAIARDFVAREEYSIPLAVDGMDNAADQVYAGWPERLYVIDERGAIAFKGETGPFGFDPEQVDAWLDEHVAP
jgi:iodothyronine deiodinase-like protein